MEITKVNKDEIISVGREALGKIKNNELAVLDNITITLALIIGAGLDKGYKIRIPFYEFSDFSGLITKVAKVESCIAVISIPRNPPLNVLNGIRGVTDNAIHAITNIDKTLISETVIHLTGIKPERREEYAIDYATKLL